MKLKVNTLIYSLLLIMIFSACESSPSKKIIIENKSNLNYESKVVEIPWEKIAVQYPELEITNFKIIEAVSKKEVPFQLEYAGNIAVKNVLVQVSLNAGSAIELAIETGKPSEVASKTYGRFVPERFDDFAWENDKIAFRMYGKALELRGKGNAYGIDVWVKSTDKLVINERYKRGKYHENHGDGMDYYHVGHSLGAGNIAPYKNDSIWYSKNYYQYKVLDNGPLRTTFQLDFEPWMVDGQEVTATKIVSLEAGTQLSKMAITYSFANAEPLQAVIGIIKRPEEGGQELFNVEDGILAYWEPTHGDDGTTGVGVIIPSKVSNMKLRNDQYIAEVEVLNNEPFVYYTGAAWDQAGVITNQTQWFKYLETKKQELLNSGIEITFKPE